MAIVAENSRFGTYGRPILAWVVALLFFFPIFWLVFTSFQDGRRCCEAGIPVLLHTNARQLSEHD